VDKSPGVPAPGAPGVPVKHGRNKVFPKIVEIKVANDPKLVYN
jgi:hypothetical protein